MKRLTLAAAAFAAGSTIVAAYAQESAISPTGTVALAVQEAATNDTNATKGLKFRPDEHNASSVEIDTMKTASVKADEPRGKNRARSDARKNANAKNGAAKNSAAKNTTGKSRTKETLSKASSANYGTIIARYASSYGVPVSLAHAVIRVESNYRATARGSAGEIGLMQIKPATARMMGYSGSAKGLFDPDTNIRYGMKYLAMAHKLGGGDTCGTILRYNAGHAARRMNPVSAAYCKKVKQHLASN